VFVGGEQGVGALAEAGITRARLVEVGGARRGVSLRQGFSEDFFEARKLSRHRLVLSQGYAKSGRRLCRRLGEFLAV
jgi:hypothetical protein